MRFGLERMRRLLTALGSPQRAFRAIHVVGTNGKSSTVRMAAAILEAHGVRTGSYLSPHLSTFAERIRIGDADLEPDAFGAAVERAAAAAVKVDRTLSGGERVTQFELLTAAAFSELAERGVEAAVVEAGLGGRHDATNVLAAPVAVLTNVGLEHTRWLGPTITDIAREKLAVVAPGATLVVGELDPEAEAEVAKVDARVVRADPADGAPFTGFQRANFAVAREAAAAALHGELARGRRAHAPPPRSPSPGASRSSPRTPLTIFDGAHNPSGVAALAAALRDAVGERPLVAVISVLDDKDAAGMLRELLPLVRRRRVHRLAQPARAQPGHAGVAVEPARRTAGRDRGRPARARSSGRASSPATTAPSWPPARSTWSPTCCPRRGAGGRRRCEPARPRRAADGGPRGRRRGARYPRLLRARLPLRPDVPVTPPGTLSRCAC